MFGVDTTLSVRSVHNETIGETVGSDWLETFCSDSTGLSEATLSWEGRSSSLNELSEDALFWEAGGVNSSAGKSFDKLEISWKKLLFCLSFWFELKISNKRHINMLLFARKDRKKKPFW